MSIFSPGNNQSQLRSRNSLDPWQVSAHFLAYTWFLKKNECLDRVEAAHFAKNHWRQFLPAAHEGFGRLLIRLTTPRISVADRIRKLVRQKKLTVLSGQN